VKQVEQEGRLSRWSRRKQQTAEETQKEDLALKSKDQELPEGDISEALIEGQAPDEAVESVLTDTDMEPVESLTEESDFSKFMSPGVSDELRNLALRKMFNTPFFNIRDGLDEYDEDYTTFEKLGDIVTADMRHQMEMEAEAKKIAELEADADKQELDGDVEQPSAVEAEAEDEDGEGAGSDTERVEESNEIPDQSPESIQQKI